MNMDQNLTNLKNEALAMIMEAETTDELEQIRVRYLSKKGKLNNVFAELMETVEDKKQLGQVFNQAKQTLEDTLEDKLGKLSARPDRQEWFDVTQPGLDIPLGHLHPISQAIEEITQIFKGIGFTRVRYPEVDWDWYVFEALNFIKGHPARDDWETYWIDYPPSPKYGEMVLSTHTSNGQVREMERVKKPPIRMLNIAKCYRRQQDVTHVNMFHQFEGLVIDKGINIQNLKGTIDYFAKNYYGPKAKSRIRPYNFPFTEPSFEVDFTCTNCDGKGCKFCKAGWHEVGGAGMVHPDVLKAGNIDSKEYTGFAFGWGIERTYTLKPGLKLDDIRPFYDNQLKFLEQF